MKKSLLVLALLASGCVIQADKDGKVVPNPVEGLPTTTPTSAPKYPKCVNTSDSAPGVCPNLSPMPDKCWDGGITIVCKKPTPTPGAVTPTPEATPTATPQPLVVSGPKEVMQCTVALVYLSGVKESDDVVIWAEKKYHVGRMFFDGKNDRKYLPVKLNTSGQRTLDFKVNGEWQQSLTILVKESQENCAAK